MAEALTVDMLPAPHGFFTRRGGVSTGSYASLNCSLSSQDDRWAVLENRVRAARSLGADPDRLLGLTQVHGARVITATQPWAAGQGEKADAMVTSQPSLALGIVTADCAPVLFADAGRHIVGAAHAGWRGAVAGVLESTVAAMAALGATPDRITAAIGPCIAQSSYEVGPDLRDAVLARSACDSMFFTAGLQEDRWQFDLPGYCAARLRAAGVGHIIVTGCDTLADEDGFFSHRRRTLALRGARASLQGWTPGDLRMGGRGAAGESAKASAGAGPIGHQISIIRPA